MAELQASVEAKLEADTEFQSSLASLSDDDKINAVNERKQSEIDSEISRLADEAEARKKSDEIAGNQKTRAEKAEGELKKLKGNGGTPNNPPEKDAGISQSDFYALMRNNVPEEDAGEVADYAKLKGVSVAEALKTGFVQARLKTLGEERVTAKATSTGKSPRGSGNVSGDSILEKARNNGELPESDDDMRKLVEARLGVKK